LKVTASTDEKGLLLKLNAGDRVAFGQIFTLFYRPLCFFATRLAGNSSAAEEIVQDTFFKIWERHADFLTLQSLKAFLYIATRNACYNYRRQQKSGNSHLEIIAGQYEPDEETVLHRIIETEVYRELTQAIETLPDQCRKVMKMSFDGLKPKDIALELGITVSTVNSQKMRGISLLKGRLSGEDMAFLIMMFTIHVTR
jgi:RNA polymerase sigma-70 factor (family 1)